MLTYNVNLIGNLIYPFCFLDNAFTEDQLQKLESYCENLDLEKATVVGKNDINSTPRVRKSKRAFLVPNHETRWIFDQFSTVISTLNNDFYQFDLIGFDQIQYTVYDKKGDNYNYHMDLILGRENMLLNRYHMRKLSVILFLQNKNEFEGGEFELYGGEKNIFEIEQTRGRIVIFPSYIIHRVKPIKKGTRKSLVIWVEGPHFK